MAAKHAKQSKKRRNHVINFCIPLLLCTIVAESALLIRQERTLHPPVFRALDTRRQMHAAADYLAHYRGTEPPDDLMRQLSAELDAVCADYRAGNADFDTALHAVQAAKGLQIPALTTQADTAETALKRTEHARQTFANAVSAAQKQDDAEAIRLYRSIPTNEPELYQQAQTALSEVTAHYRETVLAQAAGYVQDADYDAAAEALDQALNVLKNDAELQKARDHTALLRTVTLRHKAMLNARLSADRNSFADAFAALGQGLQALPDDPLLGFVRRNLSAQYLRTLKLQTEALAQQGKITEAAQMLTDAEQLLPEAADRIAPLMQAVSAYQPQKLSVLKSRNFIEWTAAEQSLTDRQGTEYPADGNLYYTYDGTHTGRQSASGEFSLGGSYSTLSLTAAPLRSFAAEKGVVLEIYGDGKLLRAYPIGKDSAPQKIRTDVSGVGWLRICVKPSGSPDLQSAGVLIAGGTVSK